MAGLLYMEDAVVKSVGKVVVKYEYDEPDR